MAARAKSARKRTDRTVTYTGLFRLHDWLYLGPLAICGVILGVWGFNASGSASGIAALVKSVGLIKPSFDYYAPWQLVLAEILMPALFLIGGAKLLLINLRRDVRVAMAWRQSSHTIVCGLGSTGRQIVENLLADRQRVVAVTLDDADANAAACEKLGVPVLKGDATQVGMLRLAGLLRADNVVVTCGSDTTNIEIALRIKAALDTPEEPHSAFQVLPEMLRVRLLERLRSAPIESLRSEATGRTRPLLVLPEVRGAWLLDLVRTHPTATLSSGAVETRPFDLAANAASLLLDRPEFGRVWRMCSGGRKPALQPHLVLAGFGEFGMQIVSRAVQTSFALPDCRLAVTIIDQQGEESAAELNARFPGLQDLIDWQFIKAVFDAEKPASWPQVWNAVEEALAKRDPGWTTVAVTVALRQDRDSLHAALQMRERLDRLGSAGTPVFVRLRQRHELGEFATSLDGEESLLDRLIAFGDLGDLTSFAVLNDQTRDAAAHAIHENYRRGDARADSDLQWARLPERLKQSNRAAADHVPTKLGAIGMRLVLVPGRPIDFTEAEIETMATVEHYRWLIERKAAGWTTGPRGSNPDPVARRHPDLVSWQELDEADREKDRVVVRTIAKSVAAAQESVRREQLIDASGGDLDAAAAALAAVPAHDQAVVLFDPNDPASYKFAEAAAGNGAKLWVVWHEGRPQRLVAATRPAAALHEAIEIAVSSREVAAMLGKPLPRALSRQPRSAAASRRRKAAVEPAKTA